MNFKRFHESRNLCPITSFDKTTDVYYTILFNTPIPTGTYTLGAKITSTSAESRISFRKADMTQIIASNIVIQTDRSQLTVTLNEPCYGMYIYGGTTVFDNIPIKYENIMLNEGSTPLPYEPPSSEVWHNTPHYIHKTDTDTITTLPADIYANDTTATVGLKGNMVQSSTPSPSSPIQPQECGERTGNLFDRTGENVGYYVDSNGDLVGGTSAAGWTASDYIEIEENTQYTFNPNTTAGNSAKHCFYNAQKQPFASYIINSGQQTFTTPSGAKYARFSYRDSSTDIMLNSGSTVLPYEPYGVKIPISSANTTTPVYLGEVETTRKIVKYEFTGQENWYAEGSDIFYTDPITEAVRYAPICSHFFGVDTLSGNNQVTISQSLRINIKTNGITHTASDFKTYLQQQYAAGTPVTVWYVLATEETGIVNEPLRKIGNYVDTVSGITIPTIAGANTLSIGTTLQPSEVTVNYKGWHPVQSVHERESGQWD